LILSAPEAGQIQEMGDEGLSVWTRTGARAARGGEPCQTGRCRRVELPARRSVRCAPGRDRPGADRPRFAPWWSWVGHRPAWRRPRRGHPDVRESPGGWAERL